MAIAAVLGRVLWPVLPQEVFREDMRNYFIQLKALLNRAGNAEKIRTQLAILPVEAQRLEIVNRHRSIADALEECRSIVQTLQLHRHIGDYRL
jgi:hypothetical protein